MKDKKPDCFAKKVLTFIFPIAFRQFMPALGLLILAGYLIVNSDENVEAIGIIKNINGLKTLL